MTAPRHPTFYIVLALACGWVETSIVVAQNSSPTEGIISPSQTQAPANARETVGQVEGQDETALTFSEFIRQVEKANLTYAAQKLNVSIAEAQISLTRLWPNPVLTGGYNTPLSQHTTVTSVDPSTLNPALDTSTPLPTSLSGSISQTIPLGGKMSARESVAKTNANQVKAQLEDFFRNLRGTSACSFIDALTAQLTLERQLENYHSLQKLTDLNLVRFKAGDVSEGDYLGTRVASLQALSQLHAAASAARQANLGLAVLMGAKNQKITQHPVGDLHLPEKSFDLSTLIANAIAGRADVRTAMRSQENANAQLKLVKANRVPDVTAAFNYLHTAESANPYSTTPENEQVGFSLSVPLPFSNFNMDDLKSAKLAVEQSEHQVKALQAQAESDVRQAYARYFSAVYAVKQFTNGIIQDSEKVLDIQTYSYKKGNAPLLDVLSAESSLSSIYQSYYSALNEQAKALVNLQQVSGVWDLRLN